MSRYCELMYCLFVDLDGVLVDFDGGVERITGKRPHELEPRAMWPRLAGTPGFYDNLDWLEDGKRLWRSVQGLHPTILTGLPMGTWAEPQKRSWCRRELGDTPVETCMSRQKASRARELSPERSTPVLIDDRDKLRDAWEKMGGVFIHHTDVSDSLAALSSLPGPFVSSLR